MNYIIYSLLAAFGFGFYNFFVGKTENKITPFVGTLVLSLTAAALSLLVIIVQKFIGGKVMTTPDGIKFAVSAGIATGIAEIFYFFAFTKNPNISVVLPIVFTITVVTGVLLGVLFNHEILGPIRTLGIFVALVALFLLTR